MGTVERLILPFYLTVKCTCIISCIFGHLTEPLPFGDVVEDSWPITSWISKTFLQLKGWHLKKQQDRGPLLVISGISGISFFMFFVTFFNWCETTTFRLRFFQRYTQFQIPLFPPFKVSNLFQVPSLKMRSSHSSYPSNLSQSSYSCKVSKPTQSS